MGDFDADNNQDIAIILTNNEKTKTVLIAALNRNGNWGISKLPTWCESIDRCYVEELQPGSYERTRALDSPIIKPDEREHITSKSTGILAGTIESTGIAYFYLDQKWFYVWVSD